MCKSIDNHIETSLTEPRRAWSALVRIVVAVMVFAATMPVWGSTSVADTLRRRVDLREVVVVPTKEKYSKRDNPAVAMMERLRADARRTDPRRHPYYRYERYDRMTVALNDFHINDSTGAGKQFQFLRYHTDTSTLSGRPILDVTMREKSSRVAYRQRDDRQREVVDGIYNIGVTDFISDQENVRTVLEDIFREIDIYEPTIKLLQNRFVSPLSPLAADFYKFYLTDTVAIDGDKCAVLAFVPHTPQTWGFTGKLFVPLSDSTLYVKRVELYMPHSIKANFVDGMALTQNFTLNPDGTRLKTDDQLTMELSLSDVSHKLHVQRVQGNRNFSFTPPADEDETFAYPELERVADEAYERPATWWNDRRFMTMRRTEAMLPIMMAGLKRAPTYRIGEGVMSFLESDYIPTGYPSKVDIGPILSAATYNTVEGWRLRAGFMTMAALSRRWFSRGYVAYGLRDRRWKYSAEVEYSFIDKKRHSREFPIHSLRLTSLYDLHRPGQTLGNDDNIFYSLRRMADTRVIYRRRQQLDYTLELRNRLSLVATAAFERREATPYLTFSDGEGRQYGHYGEASAELRLRYAPGEKFSQGRTGRVRINLDTPVWELSHKYAPKGVAGSRFEVNRTEARVAGRVWLSAFGYIDAVAKGGHVWSSSPYIDLMIAPTNISYIIKPEAFALANPLEFVNDTYGMVDLTYNLNGLIMTRLPLLNHTALREVVNFKALWGHMSRRNDPAIHPDLLRYPEGVSPTPMNRGPYMELSAGLTNVLRVFRVEYVRRLSYRSATSAPLWGVRFGVQISF